MINKRRIGLSVLFACAVAIGLSQPFAGLTLQGNYVIAVTLSSLALWIFKHNTTPYFAGCAVFLAGCLIAGLPLATITSAYTGSAIWILIPSFFFGFAILKTGLGTRIAYFILQALKPGYFTICLSWLIIGLALSALTPSITVRLSIVMPIAMSFARACKIPERSRGSALITFSAWAAALLPGIAWKTGSLWGIIIPGFYPAQLQGLASPEVWFAYMAVPWFSITFIFFALIYLYFKPREALHITRETMVQHYRSLGRITTNEVSCGAILICALALFSTEKLTGIPGPVTALSAFAALILTGSIRTENISSGVNWDIVHFIAIAMTLPAVFSATGISEWASSRLTPYLLTLALHPLTFLLVICAILFAARFVDVPWGYATIALFSSLLTTLYAARGLHPVFVSVAFVAAGNSFFFSYHQPFIIVGDAMAGSKGWSERHVMVAGLLYAASVMAGICLSFFYWRAAGLIP